MTVGATVLRTPAPSPSVLAERTTMYIAPKTESWSPTTVSSNYTAQTFNAASLTSSRP